MSKHIVSTLTAASSTETTKQLIDTIEVPQGVTKLKKIGADPLAGTAGLTTLEGVSGILEVECDNASQWGGTQQFLMPSATMVTSGLAKLGMADMMHDCDIPVAAGNKLKLSATYDLALTINPKVRVQLVFV